MSLTQYLPSRSWQGQWVSDLSEREGWLAATGACKSPALQRRHQMRSEINNFFFAKARSGAMTERLRVPTATWQPAVARGMELSKENVTYWKKNLAAGVREDKRDGRHEPVAGEMSCTQEVHMQGLPWHRKSRKSHQEVLLDDGGIQPTRGVGLSSAKPTETIN